MAQTTESTQIAIARHHRPAVLTIFAMLAFALLLVVLTVANMQFAIPSDFFDPTLAGALWIAIVVFGLGAVVLRRTMFAAMRLQDIAAVSGTEALLSTLQNTTILVALLGGSIALMGFLISLITRDKLAMLRAAPIAFAVLFYCYPRRRAWQRTVDATQPPDPASDGDGNGASASPAKGTIA